MPDSTAGDPSQLTLDEEQQAISLDEGDWDNLLANIEAGSCTPFLGAGACVPRLPSAADLAQEWSEKYGYPLDDRSDLSRVAQFLATTRSNTFPKLQIKKRFDGLLLSDASPETDLLDLHGLLAGLPLPVYVTTNYDDLMLRALRARNKSPRQELCRWNNLIKQSYPSVYDSDPDYQPTVSDPLVYHLHGSIQFPPSLVLTEDDYLDFLINMDEKLLPPRIQEAFTGASILFLGYGLNDWNFRLLFRTLVTYMQRSMIQTHVSVQLVPLGKAVPQARKIEALKYLDDYYYRLNIKVYWGTCRQFTADLERRWAASHPTGAPKSQAQVA